MSKIKLRAIAANGVLGSGFRETSLARGLELKPDFIGCDAGSTDPGPYYLGSGQTAFPRLAIKRDLSLLMVATRQAQIPLIIGSAGTAGGYPHVESLKQIVLEIAEENKLSFKLAIIQAEQKKDQILKLFQAGKITPLGRNELDEDSIKRAERIVAMMGVDPFIYALQKKADIIIAGRASDCAIYAALPLLRGVDPGIAWHAAKILECGAAAAENRSSPDCLFAQIEKNAFEVEPLATDMACTPQSVAAHSLYENANPFEIVEPDGVLNISNTKYEAVNSRRVRVMESVFWTNAIKNAKLEGAVFLGYQSVIIGGIRDPQIINQIDDWVAKLKQRLASRVHDVFDKTQPKYHFNISIYGQNAVMGPLEPEKKINSHEIGLVLELTAESQNIANTIIAIARHQALHLPIPQYSGLITGFACRHSPPFLERGKVFKFIGNSTIETPEPLIFFPCHVSTITEGRELH